MSYPAAETLKSLKGSRENVRSNPHRDKVRNQEKRGKQVYICEARMR